MMTSRPKSALRSQPKGHRIDLFSALLLFVVIALPMSLLYQVSVHYLGDNPAVAVVDMLRTSETSH
ncbi:hypothetical protein Thiowin_02838 [Thiorhodovibrio winogradskyi]|uniref:Uncharacterized protein n=1 Tax=Thiorhodovibrio winogradskyi TaxID=77007 RepID=A0ABZ0S9T1_9GAMM|nr:hypothetical protein [Thiorhodovibrio winogradskyi]